MTAVALFCSTPYLLLKTLLQNTFQLKFAYNDDDDDDDTTTNEIDTPPLLWCLAFPSNDKHLIQG